MIRLVAVAVLVSMLAAAPSPETRPAREEVVIAGELFRLEPATDTPTRARGLGGREKIDDHGGMLFVFADTRHRSFWMKDCLIDIDVAFLDTRGRIVAVHKMKIELPRADRESAADYERRLKLYPSTQPTRFAVELKTGSIDRLKLKTGQLIELDLARLKKKARW
jgi:uncharacterized membrane protein (UPF0127 family)